MDDLRSRLREWLSARRNPLWGLDFDGTLVELDPDPARVKLSSDEVRLLNAFARTHACALISGRRLSNLMAHAPILNVIFVGNHGAEVRTPDGKLWEWGSDGWQRFRAERLGDLKALVAARDGRLEDKQQSLTIHYRGSSQEQWWTREGAQTLDLFVAPCARLMGGVAAWNITGVDAPDKGLSVLRLCQQNGFDGAIYFGDEPTDETVFELRDVELFGIKVGPGPTAARHHLAAPEAVFELLREFA